MVIETEIIIFLHVLNQHEHLKKDLQMRQTRKGEIPVTEITLHVGKFPLFSQLIFIANIFQ